MQHDTQKCRRRPPAWFVARFSLTPSAWPPIGLASSLTPALTPSAWPSPLSPVPAPAAQNTKRRSIAVVPEVGVFLYGFAGVHLFAIPVLAPFPDASAEIVGLGPTGSVPRPVSRCALGRRGGCGCSGHGVVGGPCDLRGAKSASGGFSTTARNRILFDAERSFERQGYKTDSLVILWHGFSAKSVRPPRKGTSFAAANPRLILPNAA
jgi:hypothetical protein